MMIMLKLCQLFDENRIAKTPVLGFLLSTVEDQVPPHLYSFAQHGQVAHFHLD